MKTVMTCALLGALGLAGCATPYSYSQLYGSRYHLTPIDTYPVIVAKVDGESYLRQPVLVDPGERKIVVQGPPGAASRYGDEREVSLDVKPCTRYYLVAQKDNRLARAFEVKVDYEEPIAGCTPPAAASSTAPVSR